MKIRKTNPSDKNELNRLRDALWPGSPEEHASEIDSYFAGSSSYIEEIFVMERPEGLLGGFIELGIRDYAEGCSEEKVPYVEGWYVDEDLRGSGIGKDLMLAAEEWAREKGFSELASDAGVTNTGSIEAHKTLGFRETVRIVCFIKKLS